MAHYYSRSLASHACFTLSWRSSVSIESVEKTSEEFWWLVNPCSPPLAGGEHVVLQQKLEREILKQRYCLDRRDIQEVVD